MITLPLENALEDAVILLRVLLATFSKQVVRSNILLLFLGEKSASMKIKRLFYCMREMELKPI